MKYKGAEERRLQLFGREPNAVSLEALEQLEAGNGVRLKNADEFFKEIGI